MSKKARVEKELEDMARRIAPTVPYSLAQVLWMVNDCCLKGLGEDETRKAIEALMALHVWMPGRLKAADDKILDLMEG